MNLKNYTSETPASRSISKIESLLVEVGAKNINKEYVDGNLKSLKFLIDLNDNTLAFKLPAKVDAFERVLKSQIKRPRPGTYERIAKQAERGAWKTICDWVECQVTMIKLEQVELAEVFLPYHYLPESDQTLFERVKAGSIKLLN